MNDDALDNVATIIKSFIVVSFVSIIAVSFPSQPSGQLLITKRCLYAAF